MEWATAGLLMSALGTVGEVVGGIFQANQQASAYEDEAKAVGYQTRLERQAAEKRNQQIISRNRAMAAGAGIDPFSGSSLEVEFANAFDAGMNEASIQYAGDVRKRAAKMGASQSRGQIPGLIFSGLSKGGSIMGNWYGQTKYAPGAYQYPNSPWKP
jgi:hypothetical protein